MAEKETKGGAAEAAMNPELDSGGVVASASLSVTPYDVFEQCIARASNLVSMHDATWESTQISEAHYCDCYRAAVVLSISALDAYIRKVVVSETRDILADSAKNLNKELSDYIKLLLNQDKLLDAARKSNLLDVVEESVKDDFSTKSFQGEWKISKHLAMVGHGEIFAKVSIRANINEKNLKDRLAGYTNRRHIIAHSGDYDLNQTPHVEHTITKKYATDCIDLVRLFACTMNEILEGK